tara:strand:+ start:786 stop:1670 length:885 start_codon:yes stop_codon:yes gene_type:complete
MDLKKELDDNEIILSIFAKNYYNESIFELLRKLEDKKVCYVTLNKAAENLEDSFKFHKVKTDKLFFIDAISRGVGKCEERDNTIFVSSPAALTELSIAITQSLKLGVFDVVLFDSLSTLNMYQIRGKATQRFTSSVINKIKSSKKKGVFTCLEDDTESELIKSSFLYVDKVLHPSLFYHSFKGERRKNVTKISTVVVAVLGIVGFLGFGGKFGQEITGYSILESSTANPNFLLLFGGVGVFSLIFFIGAVVYKKYSLRLISDEDLEQLPVTEGSPATLKKRFKNKILGWLKKVE